MAKNNLPIARCPLCDKHLPRRSTYAWEPELNGWLCKKCWYKKYDSNQGLGESTTFSKS